MMNKNSNIFKYFYCAVRSSLQKCSVILLLVLAFKEVFGFDISF